MLELGPLGFAQPWLLVALAGLPVLWWLLRVTPPAPRTLGFPAIRLLTGLRPPEETPARTPWWLMALRLLAAALVIVALAQPLINPGARLGGSGPLVLVVDDGWAAARGWSARQAAMAALIDRAARAERRVVLLTTARRAPEAPIEASAPLPADEARELAAALEPKPWPVDRTAARAAVETLELTGSAHVAWLADGLAGAEARALAEALQGLGRLQVLREPPQALARVLLPPEAAGARLDVPVLRAATQGEDLATVVARAEDGSLVARAPARFAAGQAQAEARFELPAELRNRIARLAVEGAGHAGAVALLDERWRRRPVGLVSTSPLSEARPLLGEVYYIERALKPYAELHRGELPALLERRLPVLVMADRGALPAEEAEALAAWVERGGLLLRFAGPQLARSLAQAASGEAVRAPQLLPVRLRLGDRALGGTMSWGSPARLAPFQAHSPFAGLQVPEEVTVRRQVLAEPTLDLGEKTWARLSDGTPLVTADRRGEGWIVLVHTSANTEWSNLPLSGLFVEMLRRTVAVSQAAAGTGGEPLAPARTLDGFGRLGAPPAGARPIAPEALAEGKVGPAHPPGLYGRRGERRAHNLGPAVAPPQPLADLPAGAVLSGYALEAERALAPWLLAAALALVALDLVVALALRGLLPRPPGLRRAGGAAAVLLVAAALTLAPRPAGAQDADDSFALKATLETRLAYVETGVPAVDEASRQGLLGLTQVLTHRTAVEPGEPMAVDPARDELAFFPLLYWPVTPEQRSLTEAAVRKVDDFLANGGTIFFDLREPQTGSALFGRATPGAQALRRLTREVDMPRLEPVGPEHVLTKAFYLMQEFPGRFSGGTLWVERTDEAAGGGVASVIVGSNDWAGAWAIDVGGRPLFAVVPGGERQREMAYRFGVNLVMYALTGNYKADQVHVPAILERLGQ